MWCSGAALGGSQGIRPGVIFCECLGLIPGILLGFFRGFLLGFFLALSQGLSQTNQCVRNDQGMLGSCPRVSGNDVHHVKQAHVLVSDVEMRGESASHFFCEQ